MLGYALNFLTNEGLVEEFGGVFLKRGILFTVITLLMSFLLTGCFRGRYDFNNGFF
jgi:hypothetical protein